MTGEKTMRDAIKSAMSGEEEIKKDETVVEEQQEEVVEDVQEEESVVEGQEDAVDEQEQEEVVEPEMEFPRSWKQEDKELVSESYKKVKAGELGADEFIQKVHSITARREDERDKFLDDKSTKYGIFEKRWLDTEEALNPLNDLIVNEGIDKVTAIRQLVGLYNQLQSNPKAVLTRFGLELAQDEQWEDPQAESLELQNKIESSVSNQVRQQVALREAENKINSFIDEIDEFGNKKHPHFDKVQVQMEKLIKVGEASTLEDAYEKACYIDPTVRSEILNSQIVKAQPKPAPKADPERLRRAKAASFSPKSDSPSRKTSTQYPSMRDEIAAMVKNIGN